MRKTIALLVSGSFTGVQDYIIDGVRSGCNLGDINLLVFNQLTPENEIDEHNREHNIKGECAVFSLIPWDRIDGFIIDSRSFLDEVILKEIIGKAKSKNIPVICINDLHRGCFHIEVDDFDGEASLIRHLVEEHGISRINFIGGFPGNEETETRLAAYKQVLAENNIPIEEERIGYGLFGSQAAKALQGFLDSELPFPDAIVCANDAMAIEVIARLIERGYNVPEDVKVVGFDAYIEALMFYPTITTVRRGLRDCGEYAVRKLIKIWNGKNTTLDEKVVPDIVFGQSCGCVKKTEQHIIKMYEYQHNRYIDQRRLHYALADSTHYAFAGKTLREFFARMKDAMVEFNFDKMWFCMEKEPQPIDITDGNHLMEYKDVYIEAEYNTEGNIGKKCTLEEIVPGINEEGSSPSCYIFSPIYARNYNLGFIARKIKDNDVFRGNFRNWLSVVSSYICVYSLDNEKQ